MGSCIMTLYSETHARAPSLTCTMRTIFLAVSTLLLACGEVRGGGDIAYAMSLFRPYLYKYNSFSNSGRSAQIDYVPSANSIEADFTSSSTRSREIESGESRGKERSLLSIEALSADGVRRASRKSARQVDEDSYLMNKDCCVFVFLDGSAHFFDAFLRQKTGTYTLQPGTINGHPHYASKTCSLQGRYTSECTYIWRSKGAWIIGDGTSIGETRGVMFGTGAGSCPIGVQNWKFLDEDLNWNSEGKISLECMSYDQ